MYTVLKRNGKVVDFDMGKITQAITLAFEAQQRDFIPDIIDFLALKVTADFEPKIKDHKIAVEDIQDSVEHVLVQAGYSDVAKAYILYRRQHEKLRDIKGTVLDYKEIVDNYVKGANSLIVKFETDDNFRIAVSVDMLDTGVDVPGVLNLVFFKPVKSKIKFVQMIGRGTRLCEKLIDGKDKDYFLIFDYCGNFEYFEQNVNGADGIVSKSISQRLFDVKLSLLVELQKIEHQTNPEHKAYYDKIKPELINKF